MDKNDNGVPDWVEATITYIIASICIALAVHGHIRGDMDPATKRWLIGFAVALTGERDLKKAFLGK